MSCWMSAKTCSRYSQSRIVTQVLLEFIEFGLKLDFRFRKHIVAGLFFLGDGPFDGNRAGAHVDDDVVGMRQGVGSR